MKRSFSGHAAIVRRAAFLALSLSCLAPAAFAEPTDAERAGARAAANAGVSAFDAGKWQEALDYFLRAESIIHSPVHLSYIGRARAELGQLVLAREALMKVVHEQANSPAAESAKEEAQATLAEIEPRIPELTVKVEGAADRSFEVTIDGAPVLPALVGIPGPVDPGKHIVRVTSDGAQAEQEVTIAEAETKTISLTLPPPLPGQTAKPAPAAATATTPPPDEAGASSGKGLLVGSIVGFGVGAAGIGLGVGFGLVASDKNEQASQLCLEAVGNRNCSGVGENDPVAAEVREIDAAAAEARTIATVGFVAGGVGLAVGTTLLILSLNKKGSSETGQPAPRGLSVRPVVALDYLGLAGTF